MFHNHTDSPELVAATRTHVNECVKWHSMHRIHSTRLTFKTGNQCDASRNNEYESSHLRSIFLVQNWWNYNRFVLCEKSKIELFSLQKCIFHHSGRCCVDSPLRKFNLHAKHAHFRWNSFILFVVLNRTHSRIHTAYLLNLLPVFALLTSVAHSSAITIPLNTAGAPITQLVIRRRCLSSPTFTLWRLHNYAFRLLY